MWNRHNAQVMSINERGCEPIYNTLRNVRAVASAIAHANPDWVYETHVVENSHVIGYLRHGDVAGIFVTATIAESGLLTSKRNFCPICLMN